MERVKIFESLDLDPNIERNKVIYEIYDYMRLNNCIQHACKVCIYMHEQLPEWVQTKENFIEFFSNEHNHIKMLGVELIKYIRDYLDISVLFDGVFLIESIDEQKKVYTMYLDNKNIFETAKAFSISYIEAKIIISKFENGTITEYLICDIRNFLRKRNSDMEVKVCNSLGRYLSQYPEINTKAQLRKIIYEDEVYIRNFGAKAKNVMKEYFFTQ